MHRAGLAPMIFACFAACATSPVAVPDLARTTDQIMVRALKLEARARRPLDDPSLADAERDALELAGLAQAAATAPLGDRYHGVAKQLAWAADSSRNVLLSCKEPMWRVRKPLVRLFRSRGRGVGLVSWLNIHQRDLMRGRRAGYVASRAEVEGTIRWLEGVTERLTERDSSLYGAAALRHHQAFLDREILPHAPQARGLVGLPTGRECYVALAARALGPSWDVKQLRRRANAGPARAPDRYRAFLHGMGAVDETVRLQRTFYRNEATWRGWQTYVGHFTTPDRAERRRSLLSFQRLGALIELGIHLDGWSIQHATEFAIEHGARGSRAANLVSHAASEPLWFASSLVGYEQLVKLRSRIEVVSGPAFDPQIFIRAVAASGALPAGLLMFEVRRRLGIEQDGLEADRALR